MEFSGKRRLPCDRHVLWDALDDPKVLEACIPGAETVTGSLAEGFRARAKFALGPLKTRFKGKVRVDDIVRHESYTLVSGGKSKATGAAALTVRVTLTPVPGGTELAYDAQAEFGGVVARMGGMLLNGFARRTVNGFMDRLEAQVRARA